MALRSPPWLMGVALAAVLASPPAGGQPPPSASTVTPSKAAKAAARAHFERARALFKTGAYRETLDELEAARALDPTAKELVYNLAVVHEKLGELDDAVRSLQTYLAMDVTPAEASKAKAYVRRLEGAKREVAAPPPSAEPAPASSDTAPVASDSEPAADESQPSPSHGRIDAATVTAFGVGVAALGAGAFFGVKALSDRPTGFVTGQTGSFADFQSKNDQAHREAIIADVALGVGVVSLAVAAYLYFGRTKALPAPKDAAVRVAPRPGGGAVVVQF